MTTSGRLGRWVERQRADFPPSRRLGVKFEGDLDPCWFIPGWRALGGGRCGLAVTRISRSDSKGVAGSRSPVRLRRLTKSGRHTVGSE